LFTKKESGKRNKSFQNRAFSLKKIAVNKFNVIFLPFHLFKKSFSKTLRRSLNLSSPILSNVCKYNFRKERKKKIAIPTEKGSHFSSTYLLEQGWPIFIVHKPMFMNFGPFGPHS